MECQSLFLGEKKKKNIDNLFHVEWTQKVVKVNLNVKQCSCFSQEFLWLKAIMFSVQVFSIQS